jgi:hypothetical protein
MAFTFGTLTTTTVEVRTGTGTLDELYTDIGNAAIMSKSGSVYSFPGGNVYFELENGVTLNQEANTTLQWTNRTTHDTSFTVQIGAVWNVADGCTIDVDTSGTITRYSYGYVQGEMNITGTSGNRSTIAHLYAVRFYNTTGYKSTWIYVDCVEPTYSTYGIINLQSTYGARPEHSFSYINCIDTRDEANKRGTSLYLMSGDWSLCTFDNFNVDSVDVMIVTSEGCQAKITNSTFTKCNVGRQLDAGAHRNYYDNSKYTGAPYDLAYNQSKIVFENCTFGDNNVESNTNIYGLYHFGAGVFQMKNCTFQGDSGTISSTADAGGGLVEATTSAPHGLRTNMYVLISGTTDYNGWEEITVTGASTFTFADTWVDDQSGVWNRTLTFCAMAHYNSRVLNVGTHTFNNVSSSGKYYSASGGGQYDCKTLTMTVQDAGGSPVEGALVKIYETTGRHCDLFFTNASGEVKDVFGDDPVFPYRQITNNSGTTFNNWSTYDITVSKDGYTLDTRTGVDMTSDQTIVASLTTNPAGDTTIHGSTFYGSTIY